MFSDSSEDYLDDNVDGYENYILGIDLGTTNCCVGIWRNNNLEIITDEYGNRTIPSMVSFSNKSMYVGLDSKNQLEINTENTYYETKRLIGRKFNEECVHNDIPYLTYDIGEDEKGGIVVKSHLSDRKEHYTPEEIASFLLIYIKNMSERYLNRVVEDVVVTVPAYFTDAQRQATKDACEIAQLNCLRIINEPTAAALAYGLETLSLKKNDEIYVIVYDLGGGTLDVSLLNICDGVFEVMGSIGNTHLGGSDFDTKLMNFCIEQFKKKHSISKIDNISAISLQKLRKGCEKAKKMLSTMNEAIIGVDNFYNNNNLIIKITRDVFNKICRDLLILCLKPVEDILKKCDMDRDEIDEIILVGGATRIPEIRNNLTKFFKGKVPNCSVNPDEVVAAGAAIQGYILGNTDNPFADTVILLDVTALSLGVETIGGVMTTLVPSNTIIPTERKKTFITDSDNETSVIVKIFEGERKMTKNNFFVGEFVLSGIKPAPRGVAKIIITFNIDSNGIINVTAEDKDSKNKNQITVNSNKNRLTKEEIDNLIKEARELEYKDRAEREKKQTYYEISEMCHNILVNLDNEHNTLHKKEKDIIKKDVEKIIEWLENNDYLDIQKNEYSNVHKKLTERYSTLILKLTNDVDTVDGIKNNNEQSKGTTIFGNEQDEETIFEELINEEYKLTNDMDDEERKELINLREQLIELCSLIQQIITSKSIQLTCDDEKELKDIVNDTLLWNHGKEKISKNEYIAKIDSLNKVCNDIIIKYDNIAETQEEWITKKNELESLCYALITSVSSNYFSIEETNILQLTEIVNNTLQWLIEEEIKCNKNNEYAINIEIIKNKTNTINNLCNELYDNIIGIDIKETFIMDEGEDDEIIILDNVEAGTSISDL